MQLQDAPTYSKIIYLLKSAEIVSVAMEISCNCNVFLLGFCKIITGIKYLTKLQGPLQDGVLRPSIPNSKQKPFAKPQSCSTEGWEKLGEHELSYCNKETSRFCHIPILWQLSLISLSAVQKSKPKPRKPADLSKPPCQLPGPYFAVVMRSIRVLLGCRGVSWGHNYGICRA